MDSEDVPVLVVGGGLVGLSAAVFLGAQGVRCVVVERHPGTSILPRARAFSPRTMELYHAAGLTGEITAASARSALTRFGEVLRGPTLASAEPVPGVRPQPTEGISRFPGWTTVDQHELEPILRADAQRRGADVRFGTEAVRLHPDDDGVTALLTRPGDDGAGHRIRARYVVAADGNRAGIRRRLGIPVDGPGHLADVVHVVFEAELGPLLGDHRPGFCFLERPRPGTVLSPAQLPDRWTLSLPSTPEAPLAVEDLDDERVAGMVREAVGLPGLPVRLLPAVPGRSRTTHVWSAGACVARRYQDGRIFLAGDCAHLTPPAGGFGASTGIQDVHNLAWKLGLVLRGRAGPGLLTTYGAERRPVARLAYEQSLLRTRARREPSVPGLLDDRSVVFGVRYRSDAVVDAPAGDAPVAGDPDGLRGEPGTRAPDLPIGRDGRPHSTLDLYGRSFVLATPDPGPAWPDAAARAGERWDTDVAAYRIGTDVGGSGRAFADAHGLGPSGAVLVRPDGIVGWRVADAVPDAGAALGRVLARILDR